MVFGPLYQIQGTGKGGPWRLAMSLQVLADEVQAVYPAATCLGTIGDAAHQAEGVTSDHNPFVAGPDCVGVVRAIDIAGPADIQQQIFNHIQALYEAHDPRVWQFGYVHKDGVITSWPGPGTHPDPGDDGHVHISVNQVDGYAPSPQGYLAAIDSAAPWGFLNAPPAPTEDDAMVPMMYRNNDPTSNLDGAVFIDYGTGPTEDVTLQDFGQFTNSVDGPGWPSTNISGEGLWNLIRQNIDAARTPQPLSQDDLNQLAAATAALIVPKVTVAFPTGQLNGTLTFGDQT